MRGATGVTTQIGDARFTAFRTGRSKSRQAFLSLLRAGHADYVINEAALRYMRERHLAGPVIETLGLHPANPSRTGSLGGAPERARHRRLEVTPTR